MGVSGRLQKFACLQESRGAGGRRKPQSVVAIKGNAGKHVLSIMLKTVFYLIYVIENIKSFPFKLRHSSES